MFLKMKRTYNPVLLIAVILFVQLISISSHSQTLPELNKKFNSFKGTPTDSLQVSITNKLAEKYFYNSPDSSIQFGKIALQFSKKLLINGEKARAYNNIAKTYYITGSYFESLSYADSALVISKQLGNKRERANAINTRGLIYLGQNRLNEAIPEFKKALAINEQLKDSSRIAANYFNIGLSYDELHQFEAAFANLKKALKLAEECKDGHLNQMSLNRIGETYYHSKNYVQALFYYRSALRFAAYQDNWEKGFAYSGIARTLYELKRYEEALAYATKSYELMKALNADWDTQRAANILSKCYAVLKNYQKAYEYQTIARAYGDSILDEKKEQDLNYLHLQDKKQENLELMRENDKSRQVIRSNQIIISLTVLFSILLVAALLSLKRNITRKNVLNKQLQQSNDAIRQQKEEIQTRREELTSINKTKDRVLSIIGHDLRSPFASVLQALELIRNGDLDKEDQELIFDNFYRQVSLVSELINNLLAWASSQQSGVQVKYAKINLTEIAENVLSLYRSVSQQKKQHLVHLYQEPVYIEADENHVRIILQNIISNAVKFTPQNEAITLFYTLENNFAALHVKDKGRGMSQEKVAQLFKSSGLEISENGTQSEPGTGLGLFLIKQFIEENKGRIEVKSEIDKGSEFIVYFKLSQKTKTAI